MSELADLRILCPKTLKVMRGCGVDKELVKKK